MTYYESKKAKAKARKARLRQQLTSVFLGFVSLLFIAYHLLRIIKSWRGFVCFDVPTKTAVILELRLESLVLQSLATARQSGSAKA